MADVSFNEEPQYAPAAYAPAKKSFDLIALVQKWGFAKDTGEAAKVLLIVAVAAGALAIVIAFLMLAPHHGKDVPVGPPLIDSALPTQ